ncbi:MAG: IS630 family transposase [Candidatus Competibacter sp.]
MRCAFQARRAAYEAAGRTLVWIDESGFAHDRPHRYGYAPVGQRCYGRWDWHAKERTNVIGALLDFQLIAVGLFESSVNAEVFLAWTHRVLLPQLPPATMIVLDNAAFHKRQDIQNTLRQAGHTRGYLPPYSPDLNPIEHQWAQAKALCKQSHCSVDELFRSNQI